MSELFEQQEATWIEQWQQPPTFLEAKNTCLMLESDPDLVPPFLYCAVGVALGIAIFGAVTLREMRGRLNRVARVEHAHHRADSNYPPPPDLEAPATVARKR